MKLFSKLVFYAFVNLSGAKDLAMPAYSLFNGGKVLRSAQDARIFDFLNSFNPNNMLFQPLRYTSR